MNMWKSKRSTDKPKIPDLTKLHRNMLLFKSREHYETWICFQENIPNDKKEEFKQNPVVNFPKSWWTQTLNLPQKTFFVKKEFLVDPLLVDTFGFIKEDLEDCMKDYTLYESEKNEGKCPFCRVHPNAKLMLIHSTKMKNLKPVWTYCIHLLFNPNYEVI